jgi:exosome complex RNA-binding protein Rrp4
MQKKLSELKCKKNLVQFVLFDPFFRYKPEVGDIIVGRVIEVCKFMLILLQY